MTNGKLRFAMAALAAVPRAAVVVEDRYSAVFKLTRVRPRVVADGIAELQVRYPTVPIVFCETRQLAQEWAYRSGAALGRRRLDVERSRDVVRRAHWRGTDSSVISIADHGCDILWLEQERPPLAGALIGKHRTRILPRRMCRRWSDGVSRIPRVTREPSYPSNLDETNSTRRFERPERR